MEEQKEQEWSAKFQKALLAIKKLKEEARSLKESHQEPIAIIGMAMRLPGDCNDAGSYWELLASGRDAVGPVPAGRWDHAKLFDPAKGEKGKINTLQAGFVRDIEQFDNQYFGLSPQETLYMDPQHRFLLETSYEALHNAGQNLQQLKDSNTAVYVGFSDGSGYAMRHMFTGNPADIDTYSLTGYMITGGAGRISYLLGLQGENVALNTGCSASLTALHLACQSLRTQQSDMALAAGVSLMCSPEVYVALASINGLSPDGRCKAFDATADGYGRGEGAGVLVLKRLSDAIKDGDPVLALVRGTASNQDGASNGFTAPSGKAQEKVILKALKNAGLSPADVDYVEAHGTGTPLGDPIEIEALHNTYGLHHSKENPLWVGSVKSNIGHLEGAAGIAGVIKAVLALQQKKIPKSLHVSSLNPHIDWDGVHVQVPTALQPWHKEGDQRRAGVSAFGVSGTNVHVILEEAPETLAPRHEASQCSRGLYALPLSARSGEALRAYARKLAHFLTDPQQAGKLQDIAANAALNSPEYPFRKVVVGESSESLQQALLPFAEGAGELPDTETFSVQTAFVFPGQGAQWIGMGRELYRQEPRFRQAIDACETAYQPYVNWSLTKELSRGSEESLFAELDIIQPLLFAIEVALARLWQSWGVVPQAVVGHSMGEAAAAHIAGALSLEDAAAVICLRSRLMKEMRGKGAMLLMELTVEGARQAIRGKEAEVSIAVSNSASSTVLSGDVATILALKETFDQGEIFCRLVQVDVASHSPHMDGIRTRLVGALQHIKPQASALPFYSTVQGRIMPGEALTPDYWGDNLRQAVQFTQTTQQMLEDGYTVFVEMSPHPVLAMPLEQTIQAAGVEAYAVGSLLRNQPELNTFMAQWGRLWELGYALPWKVLYPELKQKLILPTYAWQKKRFWLESPTYTLQAVPATGTRAAAPVPAEEACSWPYPEFEQTRQHLKPYLQRTLAGIMGYKAEEMGESKRFSSMGLDSMMAMRLRNKLVKELPVEFSVKMIWKHASIGALAQFLAELMHSSPHTRQAIPAQPKQLQQQEWLVVPEPNAAASYRLFCFHDAGGNPSLYKEWVRKFGPVAEVCLVQLPGRGTRLEENPITDMQQLVQALVPVLASHADKPFFFFGHSMGGIVLFELSHALRNQHLALPQKLFISAAPNFNSLGDREAEYKLSDAALMQRFPGLNCELYEDMDFHKSLMQTLRADLELLYRHTYQPQPPLDIPIVALGGLEDDRVATEGLFAWKEETTGSFELIMRPGGHRYIDQDGEFLRTLIQEHGKELMENEQVNVNRYGKNSIR